MPKPLDLVVLGCSGTGRDSIDLVTACNVAASRDAYRLVAVLDDREETWGKDLDGIPILGPLDMASSFGAAQFLFCVGSPMNHTQRQPVIERVNLSDDRFETVVHPSAVVAKSAQVGQGSIIFANSSIASGVHLGNHLTILHNSVIGHDTWVGARSILAAGVVVSGECSVGMDTYLGASSSIRGAVSIGEQSLIGMGSVVLGDVPPREAWWGVPARFGRRNAPQ